MATEAKNAGSLQTKLNWDFLERHFWEVLVPAASALRPKSVIRIHAYDAETLEGFPGCEIVISTMEQSHPKIWSSNAVLEREGHKFGFISINDQILFEKQERLRVVLAHEYLDVMLILAGVREPRRVGDKTELLLLMSALGQPALWQDTPAEEMQRTMLVRQLLVPRERLEALMKQAGDTDLESIVELARTEPKAAISILTKAANQYTKRYSVPQELVFGRMHEFLFSRGT